MNKDVAERLITSLMKSYRALQESETLANEIENVEERVTFIKGLLNVTGELEDSPILKIVKEYPDLNPFK